MEYIWNKMEYVFFISFQYCNSSIAQLKRANPEDARGHKTRQATLNSDKSGFEKEQGHLNISDTIMVTKEPQLTPIQNQILFGFEIMGHILGSGRICPTDTQ